MSGISGPFVGRNGIDANNFLVVSNNTANLIVANSSGVFVGANASVNNSSIWFGNSSVNAIANSTVVLVRAGTTNTSISNAGLTVSVGANSLNVNATSIIGANATIKVKEANIVSAKIDNFISPNATINALTLDSLTVNNAVINSSGFFSGNNSLGPTGIVADQTTLKNSVTVGNTTVNTAITATKITAANVQANNINASSVSVANLSVTTNIAFINVNSLSLGNTTVNTIINSTAVTIGNTSVNSTSVNVGSVSLSTTNMVVGNSLVNSSIGVFDSTKIGNAVTTNSSGIFVGNVTVNTSSITFGDFKANSTSAYVNSSAVVTVEGNKNLTGGFSVTSKNLGVLSSFTANVLAGQFQYGTVNSAITITAPTTDGAMELLLTNGANAAEPTFSGFTVGTSKGDGYDTTSGHKFIITILRIANTATYLIKGLQ